MNISQGRMRPVSILTLALLGLAPGASALAQDLPQVDAQRKVDFGVRGTVTHDTNVARSSKQAALDRGLSLEDTTYTGSITVDVVQPLGKQALFLSGAAGYDRHDKNRRLDGRRIDLSGGGVKLFGRGCRALAFGSYAADQSQLDDIIGTIVKNVQERTNVSAALECQPAAGFGFVGQVSRQETKNTAERQKAQDSNTDSATAVLAYVRPSLGTFRLIANFAETDYPNRDGILGASFGDHLSVSSYGVGYSRQFGRRIEVNTAAQRTLIKRDKAPAGVSPKTTATTYDADIKYQVGPRLTFTASANRSVMPSNRIGQLYDLNRNFDISAVYRLGTRIELEGGRRWESLRSKGDGTGMTGVAILTNSDKDVYYGIIRYRRTQGYSLSLDVRQEDRETNLPAFDYSNTAVRLSLDVPF